MPRLVGVVSPDARKTVGLQLQLDAQDVVVGLADLPAHFVDLGTDAQQVLHMVANFMRHDISLGKLTGRTETFGQSFIKTEVNVNLLVTRTIKRPHGRLTLTAGGLGRPPKQHQSRLLISGAALGEHVFPHVFGVSQHGRHKLGHAVVGWWSMRRRLLLDLRRR